MAKSARKYEYPHHAAVPFDPLKYVKELENVGFTREQAEVQAETFFSIVQEQLVTKYDLKELENELKQNLKEIDAKTTLELEAIRRDIKELEVQLKQNSKELDTKITTQSDLLRRDLKLWFGGMLVTLVVMLSTIQPLVAHLAGH